MEWIEGNGPHFEQSSTYSWKALQEVWSLCMRGEIARSRFRGTDAKVGASEGPRCNSLEAG